MAMMLSGTGPKTKVKVHARLPQDLIDWLDKQVDDGYLPSRSFGVSLCVRQAYDRASAGGVPLTTTAGVDEA